jgi:hypothetical protein
VLLTYTYDHPSYTHDHHRIKVVWSICLLLVTTLKGATCTSSTITTLVSALMHT